MRYKVSILILMFLTSTRSFGVSQNEKLSILKTYFPKGTTTFNPDTLLTIALTHSSTMKMINSHMISKESSSLNVERLFDTKLTATSSVSRDRNHSRDNGLPSRPDDSHYKAMSFGVEKQFSTGTVISGKFDLSDSDSHLTPSNRNLKNKETALVFELRQSLLKNALGSAYQMQIEAGKVASKVVEEKTFHNTDNFVLQTIQSYYHVWLAREFVLAAKNRLKSEEYLHRMVTKQHQIGTSERPEYLEIKISQAQAKQALEDQMDAFYQGWRRLVLSLNLSHELLDIDPLLIPMTPDNFIDRADDICQQYSLDSISSLESHESKALSLQKSAIELQYRVAQDQLKPDLYFSMSSRGNSLEEDYGVSMEESLSFRNPRLAFAFGIEVLLGNSGVRSEMMQKFRDLKQAEIRLHSLSDERGIKWVNHCRNLDVLKRKKKTLKENRRDLEEHHLLQRRRFNLGRVSVFDLHRSANLLIDNERMNSAVESELRLVAWDLRSLAGDVRGHLERILTKPILK